MSVHWLAQCHTKWPRGGREFQHHAGIGPKLPNLLLPTKTSQPLVCVSLLKKLVNDLSYYFKCLAICICILHAGLLIFDSSGWISRQCKQFNTRILECKPLIDTPYCILHRLELKYFHFAQFLLIVHRAAHQFQKKWEPITWSLGQIFKIELWMVC